MGIQGLPQFLRKKYPQVYYYDSLWNHQGKRIVIDTSYYLHRFKKANTTYWPDRFIDLILAFHKYHIIPIFVFEGKPPKEKTECAHVKRKKESDKGKKELSELKEINKLIELYESFGELEEKNEKRVIELGSHLLRKELKGVFTSDTFIPNKDEDDESITLIQIISYADDLREKEKKKEKQTADITKEDVELLKKLIPSMGVPCIQAEGEAEMVCASLVKKKKVDLILANDTDTLCYNVSNIVVDFEIGTGIIEILSLEKILEELKLDFSSYVDFCILCGTDYCDGIEGVGPVKALEWIRLHKNLENVTSKITHIDKKNKKKVNFSSFIFPRVRKIFHQEEDHTINRLSKPHPAKLDLALQQIEKTGECETYKSSQQILKVLSDLQEENIRMIHEAIRSIKINKFVMNE